jgi:hypothetical protein
VTEVVEAYVGSRARPLGGLPEAFADFGAVEWRAALWVPEDEFVFGLVGRVLEVVVELPCESGS